MERPSSGGSGRGGRTGGPRKGPKGARGKGPRKGPRKSKLFMFRKLKCKFCLNKVKKIDYLEFQNLRKFTTERGKILPARITGSCAKHQRQLAKAIKRARHVGLMPYLAEEI